MYKVYSVFSPPNAIQEIVHSTLFLQHPEGSRSQHRIIYGVLSRLASFYSHPTVRSLLPATTLRKAS